MLVLAGALICVALVGALGGFAAAGLMSGTPEVRLAAQKLGDGRVEIGLQQRLDDGSWGERLLPPSRFLAADAEPERWRHSSPLALSISNFISDHRACLITHGDASDVFWQITHAAAEVHADEIGLNLTIAASPDSEVQAELIRECAASGVAAIVTTLADPDTLAPALAEAQAAGVAVFTFNSGGREARRIGSVFHTAIDDYHAGHEVGEALTDDGAQGIALCVIHERSNIGLEERCEGFDATYGSVERLRVDATGTRHLEGTRAAIAERLAADDDIAAVLTLNQSIALAALEAIEAGDDPAVLVTLGLDDRITEAVAAGRIRYAIDDQTVRALEYMLSVVRNLPVSLSLFPDSPIFLFRTSLLDMEAAQALLSEAREE